MNGEEKIKLMLDLAKSFHDARKKPIMLPFDLCEDLACVKHKEMINKEQLKHRRKNHEEMLFSGALRSTIGV